MAEKELIYCPYLEIILVKLALRWKLLPSVNDGRFGDKSYKGSWRKEVLGFGCDREGIRLCCQPLRLKMISFRPVR